MHSISNLYNTAGIKTAKEEFLPGFSFKIPFWVFVKNLAFSLAGFALPTVVFVPLIVVATVFFVRKNRVGEALLVGAYAVCLQSEAAFYCYTFVLLLTFLTKTTRDQKTAEQKKLLKYLKIFFYYICTTYVLQLFDETSVLSLPLFAITYISPVFVLYYVWKVRVEEKDVAYLLRQLSMLGLAQALVAFFLQAIPIGITQLLNRPTFGDKVVGSTNSAPSLAIVIVFAVLPFIIIAVKKLRIRKSTLFLTPLIAFYAFVAALNDSKAIVYAVILSLGGIYMYKNIFTGLNAQRKYFIIVLTALSLAAGFTYLSKKYEDVLISYADYIDGASNKKVLYYSTAFSTETRPLYQFLIGSGPGTNGSRAANSLAYDVMFKKQNTNTLPSFIPPKSNRYTREYLTTYYTAEYALTSGYRSALLGNPFNSICAAFIEFGLIGFLFFLFIFYYIIKQLINKGNFLALSAAILIVTNLITSMLDQTMERVLPMFLMYLFIALSFKQLYNRNEDIAD